MSKFLNNIIVGELNATQFQIVTKYLDKIGYIPRKGKIKEYTKGIAIKTMKNNRYGLNYLKQYKYFIKKALTPYKNYKLLSFRDFSKEINKEIKSIENKIEIKEISTIPFIPKPEINTLLINNIVYLTKDKLIYAYEHTSEDNKNLLIFLFGKDLFLDKEYSVGQYFEYINKKFVIAKIGMNIIQMLDTTNFENFGKSTIVRDIYHITEKELQALLGIYYGQFKFIDK
jgi:hypothetical protein